MKRHSTHPFRREGRISSLADEDTHHQQRMLSQYGLVHLPYRPVCNFPFSAIIYYFYAHCALQWATKWFPRINKSADMRLFCLLSADLLILGNNLVFHYLKKKLRILYVCTGSLRIVFPRTVLFALKSFGFSILEIGFSSSVFLFIFMPVVLKISNSNSNWSKDVELVFHFILLRVTHVIRFQILVAIVQFKLFLRKFLLNKSLV